jgi:hypothetical protein
MRGSSRLAVERLRDIAARAAACAAAAALVAAVSAAVIAVSGLADDVRRTLRFGFGGLERTPAEVLRIAAHNARFAAGTLVCAALAPRLPRRTRAIVALMLATVLAFNAAAVGIALGAYGGRGAAAIALHLPVEFAALSVAGGAYLSTSRRALSPAELLYVAVLCLLLLVVAATLEAYLPLGGIR